MSDSPAHVLARGHGSITEADVDLIQKLCIDLSPRQVIDIGAGIGNTALACLEVGCRVLTIDHDQHYLNEARSRLLPDFKSSWTMQCSDSVVAAQHFPMGSQTLVLLDTTHWYEQTKRELAAWLPRLRRFKSAIWLHDYLDVTADAQKRLHFEVDKAVEEAVAAGEAVVLEQSGLGIALRLP